MRERLFQAARWLGVLCLAACPFHARGGMPAVSKEFETYMVQHRYGAVPLDDGDRSINAQTVDVEINGRKLTMFVDTGTPRTALTADCARKLKLDVQDTGHSDWGLGGQIKGNTGIALIQSFTIGHFVINRTNTILVFPQSAQMAAHADGVLGLDILHLNAAIYPVGGTGFLLKPGATPVVSIENYMSRLGYKPIPVSVRNGGLIVEGHVNGHAMEALVDTGAAFSTFESAFVRDAVGHDVPALPFEMEGFDGKAPDSSSFLPKALDIHGFSVPPLFLVSSNAPIFSRAGFNGLLGVDFLGTHRATIDLGSDILWLK